MEAGEPEEAREAYYAAIKEAEPLGAFAERTAQYAILTSSGYPELLDIRLSAGQRVLALGSEVPHDQTKGKAVSLHFADLLTAGRFSAAQSLVESFDRGSEESEVPVTGMKACLALLSGRGNAVDDLIHAARAAGIRSGHPDVVEAFSLQLLSARREERRSSEAAAAVGDLRRESGQIFHWGPLACIVELEVNNGTAARETFDEMASAGFDSIPHNERRPVTLALLAEVCAALNDTSRARVLYGLIEQWSGLSLATSACCAGPADRYLGLLAAVRQDWGAAEPHLAEAVEQAIDQPIWQARARFDLATVLFRRNRGDQAAVLVEAVLDASDSLKLAALKEDCLRLLSQEPLEGPKADGLTAAELRVLRLLASGATNRSIGEQLHLSPNTVASHVRNILAKTGAANRTEAANYARANSVVSPN